MLERGAVTWYACIYACVNTVCVCVCVCMGDSRCVYVGGAVGVCIVGCLAGYSSVMDEAVCSPPSGQACASAQMCLDHHVALNALFHSDMISVGHWMTACM